MKTLLIILIPMLPVIAASKRTPLKRSEALSSCEQNLAKCRAEVDKLKPYSLTELVIEEVRDRAPKPEPRSKSRTPESDSLADKAAALEKKYANPR